MKKFLVIIPLLFLGCAESQFLRWAQGLEVRIDKEQDPEERAVLEKRRDKYIDAELQDKANKHAILMALIGGVVTLGKVGAGIAGKGL